MKIMKDKRSRIILCGSVIIIILITFVGLRYKNEVQEALKLQITRTEEYVNNSRTLKEWQEINSNIVFVLEFVSDGVLHNIPVLLTDNGDRYMKRNPWGEYDSMGSVFIEKDVSPVNDSENWLINGHSSYYKDWNLTFLKKYKDLNYFIANSTFMLEDENGIHTFQIISFSEYDLEGEENIYLGWYNNKFNSDKNVVDMFKLTNPYVIQKNQGISYDGEQLVTLITCNMKKSDSRYVLMAIEK